MSPDKHLVKALGKREAFRVLRAIEIVPFKAPVVSDNWRYAAKVLRFFGVKNVRLITFIKRAFIRYEIRLDL